MCNKENKTDVNTYVWKLGKEEISSGVRIQSSIKMMDASDDQLRSFYDHAHDMLHSEAKEHSGRLIILKKVHDQRRACLAESFVRWLKTKRNIEKVEIIEYILDSIRDNELNRYTVADLKLPAVDPEFIHIPMDKVLDACTDSLGSIKRTYLTVNFLCRNGIYVSDDDRKELERRYPKFPLEDQIAKDLNWPDIIQIRIRSGGLRYKYLKEILKINNLRYSEMTDDQLFILRTKILVELEMQLQKQILFWREKMQQLLEIAQMRNLTLS
jgi:CRISPR/Cas system CSM-associated protein Csm2 small subunit